MASTVFADLVHSFACIRGLRSLAFVSYLVSALAVQALCPQRHQVSPQTMSWLSWCCLPLCPEVPECIPEVGSFSWPLLVEVTMPPISAAIHFHGCSPARHPEFLQGVSMSWLALRFPAWDSIWHTLFIDFFSTHSTNLY